MKRRKTSSAGAVGDGRREAAEATKREAATAAILKAIRRSPGDAQPAFDAIVRSALRLVNGHSALVLRLAGGMLHLAAHTSTGRSGDEAIRRFYPRPVGEVTLHGRAIRSRRPCCVADTERVPASMAAMKEMARKRGYRSLMAVPMLRDGVPIGSIGVSRKQSGAFSKHQIRALETFADQAVIAIENARLFNETREALERQTATSEVLRVIAASPSDTQPVFDAIARSAQKLFGARAALVCRRADDMLHLAAHTATTQAGDAALRNLYPAKLTGQGAVGKAVLSGEPASIIDVETDPAYSDEFREGARERGYRSLLAAPMLRDGAAIGAIAVTRPDPGPFSDHQVNLLKTFADQAVIAIENVRLFNETTEALEQQKASADVLSVISSSPTDITPVYRTILENVTQLCEANIAALFLYDGEFIRAAAHRNATPEFAQQLDTLRVPPSRETPTRRAVLEKRIVHVEDVLSDPGFSLSEAHRREQPRTVLSVPLLREETLIGVITVWRREPRLFTDTQVALVKTFADQAVIAIENVRLFNETKEALERQTATAEILKVIAGSPTEVQPVFDVIVERAVRLCGARFGRVYRYDGSAIHMMASHGLSANGLGQVQRMFPRPAADDTTVGRVILARQPYFVEDVERDQAVPSSSRQMMEALGTRRQLTIPMLRAGEPIGAITLGWDKPAGFDQQEASLLKTFADQAVIAIENVRLFNETKEALEQQTATAEVLKVISGSPTDVAPVFEAILKSAVTLCGAELAAVFSYDGKLVHMGATHNWPQEALQYFSKVYPSPPSPKLLSGRTILGKSLVEITDAATDEDYDPKSVVTGHWRRMLGAPMLLEGEPLGALVVAWRDPGTTPQRQVELLQTFADQAAIAIENARLFRETQEKSAQLEVANQHKSEFLANMSHELRTPLNAVIGFSEALMERMFGEVNEKQADYLKDIHESGRHLLSLINDILDLSKIEAGRMELDVSTFHLPSALTNAMTLIRERAQRHGIQLALEVDERLAEFSGDERKFKQIMLNLLSNAVKFTPDGGKVDVSARKCNGQLEVAVRDTGIGIAPEDQALVFEEFRQAGRDRMRKAEGTGLGLALTKRFVELHGGAIRLDSTPGQGSTFSFTLPVR